MHPNGPCPHHKIACANKVGPGMDVFLGVFGRYAPAGLNYYLLVYLPNLPNYCRKPLWFLVVDQDRIRSGLCCRNRFLLAHYLRFHKMMVFCFPAVALAAFDRL